MGKKLSNIALAANDWVIRTNSAWLMRPYGLAREVGIHLLRLGCLLKRGSPQQAKFIVYSQARTGSTLLVDLLNAHPRVHCDREILAIPPIFIEPFIRAKRSVYSDRVYGCKILGRQLARQVGPEGMLPFLRAASADGWRVVYLVRDDALRHALSFLLMKQRKKRHRQVGDGETGPPKVTIDIQDLGHRLKDIRSQRARDEALLATVDHIRIVYEQDLLDSREHQGTANRIFDYLGLPQAEVDTTFVRVSSEDLSDFIANAGEVAAFAAATD